MKSTKILSLILVVIMCFTLLASCKKPDNNQGNNNIGGVEDDTNKPGGDGGDVTPPEGGEDDITPPEGGEDVTPPAPELGGVFKAPVRPDDAELPAPKLGDYTYNSYSTALGSNWNPHAWETNAEQSMLGYITSPFVTIEAFDTEKGLYQWVGEMATGIKDVTAEKTDLLTQFNVNLPKDTAAADVKEGYVFEFTLNPDAMWQDGTIINADSYIYSMQQLLNPQMKNYRANLYISGESAIAGGFAYYYSLDEGYYDGVGASGYATNQAAIDDGKVIYVDVWNLFTGVKGLTDENGNPCPQWLAYNDETMYGGADGISGKWVWDTYSSLLEVNGGYDAYVSIYTVNENMGASWDGVGLIKTGEYSFIYICANKIDFNYFLTSCTDTWLVHQELYEAGKTEVDGLIVTDYCTSLDTTMSYGTYKMTSFEENKQVIYEQNEKWYGFEKSGDYLVSYTEFEVDGKYLQQYITTKVVIDVMDESVAKQKFMKGEIMSWAPPAAELSDYKFSDRLQIVDETYTMSFFFHTDVENLKALDESGKNANSVVLSNTTFRKAMSLAIDREEFVTATQAWTPAFSLMNHLYHYDIFNDPASSYRKSEEAMKAIVNLYGVEYGAGKLYPTLEAAHASITGFNGTEANLLFKQAYNELVEAGLYNGGDIKIQIGWAKGGLQQEDNDQCDIIEEQLNAALANTGFGTITLEPLGNINDRYGDTANGLYAIGYGAWGGAAFYPFRNFQVYMDPDQYDINEAGCWDPTTEQLTLVVDGKEETMTWQQWSNCMIGTGKFADASNEVKLQITAQLEEKFLAKFYRIPLAVTTVCSLNSYKIEDYTDEYNIMYGFGGFRIMDYNYDDAAWAAYVASQPNGELDYK